jgi:uncharacterized RDD family membrane protein YckC
MESIDILTGQNVRIQYEPANLLRRMGALLLDYLFMGIYISIPLYLYYVLKYPDNSTKEPDFLVLAFVLYLPIMTYHFLFESIIGGRTPGKIIAKIKVVNIDGSTPGLLSYFLRWILLPIDLFPYGGIGALCILFSKNHQRLGDLAAGTTVVMATAAIPFNLNSDFYEFGDDYQPTFKTVDLLSEGQILFISHFLRDTNEDVIYYSSIELADKIKQKLQIKSDMDNRLFLETIVKDYNYFASLGI